MALEAQLRNAIVCELGEYDFTGPQGERYPFLTLYNGRENLQMSIAKDANVPESLNFGDRVDVWFRIDQADKIVRGEDRDRAFGQLKLKVIDVKMAKAGSNGRDAQGVKELKSELAGAA